MPVYEYTCDKCRKRFDHLVRSMSAAADAKPVCPDCGSEKTVKALSVFAVGGEATGSSRGGEDDPMCGRCGGAPGSCAM